MTSETRREFMDGVGRNVLAASVAIECLGARTRAAAAPPEMLAIDTHTESFFWRNAQAAYKWRPRTTT